MRMQCPPVITDLNRFRDNRRDTKKKRGECRVLESSTFGQQAQNSVGVEVAFAFSPPARRGLRAASHCDADRAVWTTASYFFAAFAGFPGAGVAGAEADAVFAAFAGFSAATTTAALAFGAFDTAPFHVPGTK